MIIPYSVDVPLAIRPTANWGLIAFTTIIGILGFDNPMLENVLVLYRGERFSMVQLLGGLFGHAGYFHLFGNMLFLFVFGNAVNAKLGNPMFLALYFGVGIVESLAWLAVGTGPATLGASGAINGIVGAYLVFFPRNDVCIFYWFWIWTGMARVSSYWIVLLFLAFDLLGLLADGEGVNYLAHVVGWFAGFLPMLAAVRSGLIKKGPGEQTILEAFSHHRREDASAEAGARELAKAMAAARQRGAAINAAPAPLPTEKDLEPVALTPEPVRTGARPAIVHDPKPTTPPISGKVRAEMKAESKPPHDGDLLI